MNSKPKILAIKLRAIGDTVIWTSALQALRKSRPDAEIHVLTYISNRAVLENHPAVDRLHFLEGKSRLELVRELLAMRSEHFSWLVGFHATTSLCRWAWLAGAEQMALHHHSWTKTPRGSVAIPEPGRLEDAISRDYQVLRAMGLNPSREATHVHLLAEEQERAEALVRSRIQAIGGHEGKTRLVFLPGAGHHLRRYPKDLLLPVIRRVARESRIQPLVVVDRAVSEEWNLRAECASLGVPLFDDCGLREFISVVARAQKAVANDSGPGHVAVALGLKTTFLFGPGCVGDWHCYDSSVHPVVRAQVPCRDQGPRDQELFQFCIARECAHHTCMRQLEIPESVSK